VWVSAWQASRDASLVGGCAMLRRMHACIHPCNSLRVYVCAHARRESVAINASLMTLGRCLEVLRWNQQHGRRAPPRMLPYRDSKVTHLFRDALHGWGQVVLSASVSPAAKDYDETANVLKVCTAWWLSVATGEGGWCCVMGRGWGVGGGSAHGGGIFLLSWGSKLGSFGWLIAVDLLPAHRHTHAHPVRSTPPWPPRSARCSRQRRRAAPLKPSLQP
jgi:hypothetical protein